MNIPFQSSSLPSQTSHARRKRLASRNTRRLLVEQFEPRHLMAGDWLAQGPFSATGGQVEGIPDQPVIGAVHVTVADRTNPDVLWIGGTNGGVWKTTNAQSPSPNWTPLIDDHSSLSIGAIALDAQDPNTAYVGNGLYSSWARIGGARSGVIKTTDGGLSWQNTANVLVGKNISGIAANADNIVVSVNTSDLGTNVGQVGIWRSVDGGTSFAQISNQVGTGLPGGVSYDLVADPNNPDVLYTSVAFSAALGGNGIYKSTDGGATWTNVGASTMNALIVANTSNIEFAVGNANNVYVGILNAGNLAGLFRSGDGGVNWSQLDTPKTNEDGVDVGLNPRGSKGPIAGTPDEIAGGQGTIHFSIAADPINPNVVYVGGDRQPTSFGDRGSFPNSIGANDYSGRLFRGDATKTPGLQFVHITHRDDLGGVGGGTLNSTAPHADSRDMTFDALGNLIEGDDGGVYKRTFPSSEHGDWHSLIGDLQVTEMHDIAYDGVSNVFMSGNQDTGTTYQSIEGARQWTSLSTADGGDVVVDELTLAGVGQSIRYTSFQNLGGFRKTTYDAFGNLLSTDFPNLQTTSGAPISPAFRTPMAINKVAASRMVIQGTNGTYESFDGAETLIPILVGASQSGNLGSLNQDALVYGGKLNGAANPDILWVGAGSNVLLRNTRGGALNRLTSGFTSEVRDIAVDPDNWTTAVAVSATDIRFTSNQGATWTSVVGNLLSLTTGIRTVAYIPGVVDVIVAGTSRGIFYLPVDTVSPKVWTPLGVGLPNALVYEMDYHVGDDVLLAGTLGRGAWSLPQLSNFIASFFSSEDYGDAPASYATTELSAGAAHTATGPTLGFARDIDQDGVPSATADGDDSNGSDDEDGVTFVNTPIPGETLEILVNAPQGGVLNAWFDFDRNGNFDDYERHVSELTLNPGDSTIGVSVPGDASLGRSYARFRITSGNAMAETPFGLAGDGEVEDYSMEIRRTGPTVVGEVINGSFANLNRSGIGTLQLKFDQNVILSAANVLRIMNRTTNQLVPMNGVTLLGNGTSNLTWKFPAGFFANGRYTYELPANALRNSDGSTLVATAAGQFHVLRGDANGDTRVNQADTVLVTSNLSSVLGTPYRSGDMNGDGRVNSIDTGIVSSGFNNAGFPVLGLDFGDAPESPFNYPTTLARNGARSLIVNGPRLGNARDAEVNGQPDRTASGDGTDEDGVIFGTLTGNVLPISIQVVSSGIAFLNAWADLNGDGDWKDLGERFLKDQTVINGLFTHNLTLPVGAPSPLIFRFRVNTIAGYNYFGFAADGEVEDYAFGGGVVGAPMFAPMSAGLGSSSGSSSSGSTGSNTAPQSLVSSSNSGAATVVLPPVVPEGPDDTSVRNTAPPQRVSKVEPSSADVWFRSLADEANQLRSRFA